MTHYRPWILPLCMVLGGCGGGAADDADSGTSPPPRDCCTGHPAHASNNRFFVSYTGRVDGVRHTVVAEYQVSIDPNRAGPEERRILTVRQSQGNHNGGMLACGPDGYLYIGLGDGGGREDPGGHGQNPATLLGAMLRIDVDGGEPYGIPSDNPHAESPNGPEDPRPEIWAIGLRNP